MCGSGDPLVRVTHAFGREGRKSQGFGVVARWESARGRISPTSVPRRYQPSCVSLVESWSLWVVLT